MIGVTSFSYKEKAANMFVQWQKWRASFVPLDHIPGSEVEDESGSQKIYLQGLSTQGYPVIIVKAHKHFPSKDQLQFKKFVVHFLDKAIASSFRGKEIGNEKITVIIDLQQISYKNIEARALITGFQLLQVVIVNNEEERRKFIKDIDEEALLEEYGGQAKLVRLQDFQLNPSSDH